MSAPAPHVYIDTDIPAGMTIPEWRRQRHAGEARRTRRHPVRQLVRHLRAA